MNTKRKIEQCLSSALKPPAPDGLLDKLQADLSNRDIKAKYSVLRRWFAPAGGSVSSQRVAVAAVIAIAVLLPISYGATKLIRRFIAISQLPAIEVDFPDGAAALSPDGKHFAGTTWDLELVVVDTSTGKQRNLAENCFGSVAWSADGSEIAVVSRSGDKKKLLACSLKTGITRTLMEDPPWLEDWSPDGKFISGYRIPKPGIRSAVMVNLENKEQTVLAEDGAEVWASPCFSPGGDPVSYVTKETGHSVLHLQNVDGTSHTKYSDFPGDISQPIWSPDGTHIVFTGTQKGINRQYKDLWALRVQGNQFVGAPIPVVPDVEQMEFYNWSQNGQLAYRTGFELGGIFTLPVDPQTGKANGLIRQLVRRGGLGSHCWSPDDKQIVVHQENGLIFISTGSGEKIRELSLAEIQYIGRGMSWSPDGRLIAFCGRDTQKRAGIFLITVETREVKLLVQLETRGFSSNYDPTWAPDSRNIAYGYKSNIYVVDIEDGKPRPIIERVGRLKNEMVHRPVFAPDGGSVAYIAQNREDHERILMTTIDGGETKQILSFEDNEFNINIFDLSPDGRHIVFTPGNKEIWCAPTDGGKAFKIGDLSNVGSKAWAWMPKWSPKGDAVTFIVTCEQYHYWVMENFLPTE